ncbi:MAG TPA: response regulator [Deltaproteobacteria bacterium]|nr:response regulator [Deltaproteobacteria bacterium]
MKTKLLLADDEAGIRKVLGISLEDSGYDVLLAENGEEALRLFRETLPSIVLTDIKMPGVDGIELLEIIKQENPDTEVIMITGHGDMDLAIESLKLEATDFITKPINNDALDIALKRANEKIDMRNQLRAYTDNLESLVKEQSARLVEIERMVAVNQAVEGLSSAISSMAGDLEGGIKYFNEMPCFVSIHNRDLKVVAANQLYHQRLGNPVDSDSWAIYKDKSVDETTCPVGETFKSGMGRRSRQTIVYADGHELPVMVHTAPIRDKDGNLELVLEISADISEVQRLQEELRTTQQLYQQLFDEVPCYITVQDKDFRLAAMNRQFKEHFDPKGRSHCYEVYKNLNQPCPDCPVAKTFEDGLSHQAEMILTDKNGQEITALVATAPIRNAAGEIARVMEMATDITQIRMLQDNLSSLGLMMSTLSHGIKGVLTGLDAGLYLLDSGLTKENTDRVHEGLDVVKMMVERIRNVVLNILYYAKERELKWEPVDVLEFVRDIVGIIESKLDGKGIDFKYHVEDSLNRFEIDPTLIRSALINILENAIEACSELPSGKARITFDVKQNPEFIVMDIQDNGVGMTAEAIDKAFTPFFSTKGHTGTGLGLFITHKTIEKHGGTIAIIDSSPEQGTHFRIQLPKTLTESTKNNHVELSLEKD